jgi:DNA replication protein DnaC
MSNLRFAGRRGSASLLQRRFERNTVPRPGARFRNANLYLYGPVGTGKSGLAWCLARDEVAQGEPAQFVNVRRWPRELRASISAGQPEERDMDLPPCGFAGLRRSRFTLTS